MIDWNEVREEYIRGGITQGALAEKHGVPAGSLRRRAAAEGWRDMRKARESSQPTDPAAVSARTARHLALTDHMLEIIARALEDDEQLYRHVQFARASDGSEFFCERLQAFNEERAARLVKLMGELFEQQRAILGVHEYKDELTAAKLAQDERLTMSKLQQQAALAERRLELELFKLDGGTDGTDPAADGFLAALGLTGEATAHEQP